MTGGAPTAACVFEEARMTMSSYWKRDPSDTPQDVNNRLYTKLFGDGNTKPPPDALAEATWATCGPELLEAVKMAYRKHHLGDDTIGWDELSSKLLDALCNAMGDDGYLAWSKPYGQSQEDE